MANRPGKLCNLVKGKAIGAQVHESFADTFNWLVACMKNLKAGRGIKVQWPSDDTPEISLDGENNDGESGGGGSSSAVYDVGKNYDPQEGKNQLIISYTDDRGDKTIDLEGGDVKFNGTDETYTQGNEFTFESADDSNVVVTCTNGVLKIGVYYI